MTAFDREVDKLHRNLAIAFGIAFVIALVLNVWLARSITQPLSNIAIAAQQLAKGDHAVRIRTGSRDEVGLLADTLNHMTDRLKSKIDELSEDRAQLLAMLTSICASSSASSSRRSPRRPLNHVSTGNWKSSGGLVSRN